MPVPIDPAFYTTVLCASDEGPYLGPKRTGDALGDGLEAGWRIEEEHCAGKPPDIPGFLLPCSIQMPQSVQLVQNLQGNFSLLETVCHLVLHECGAFVLCSACCSWEIAVCLDLQRNTGHFQ